MSTTVQPQLQQQSADQPGMGWDYAVFAVFVVASTAYPIWDDLRGRSGAASKQNFVFATGRVSVFAIMMSMARGTLGVRTIIGYPAEQFYRGSAMYECIYGIVLAYPLALWLFVPVYRRVNVTSVYQYLHLRFGNATVHRLASCTFMLRILLSMAITMYTPCVAMQTVMGVPFWASLMTLTGISICFTLFVHRSSKKISQSNQGGLKAAITADVIQGVTIVIVCVIVVVKGVLLSGGFANVFNTNRNNGRFQFFHVGDLSTRVDTVSSVLGQAFIQLSLLGCQQNMVQRYMSLKTDREVRVALYASIPFVAALYTLPWICGTAIYAYYAACDPRQLGLIGRPDEILPFFVLDKLLVIPGCVGIFLATLFNGALCICVSNVNSLATVLWEDFALQVPRLRALDDRRQLVCIKACAVAFALIAFGGAFCVGLVNGVIEMAQLVASATGGPLVGIFLLAMFVPMANAKGAIGGMVVTLLSTLVWSVGYLVFSRAEPFMETAVAGCTNATFSPWIVDAGELDGRRGASHMLQAARSETATTGGGGDDELATRVFTVSYMYYGLFSSLITLCVGSAISWVTRDRAAPACDEKLINPYVLRAARWLRAAVTGGPAAEWAPRRSMYVIPDLTKEAATATATAASTETIVMSMASLQAPMKV